MEGRESPVALDDVLGSTSPWRDGVTSAASVAGRAGGTVTVVEGSSFCISDGAGDISENRPEGLFVLDTRILSRWELRVNDRPVEVLAVDVRHPYTATFVGRVRDQRSRAEPTLLVIRRRHVGNGMRERITLRNYGHRPERCSVAIRMDADFADVFEVKESRVRRRGNLRLVSEPTRLINERELAGQLRTVAMTMSAAAEVAPGSARWMVELQPGGEAELCFELALSVDGLGEPPRFRCGVPDSESAPSARNVAWHSAAPRFTTDDRRLARSVARATADLGALRIFDPAHPGEAVVAAGAPWFMTLFGRDSLLTSWMALPVDPKLACGVVMTLARLQGDRVDDVTEEEPGRILHEVRLDRASSLALGDGTIYYGTVDATPLFVMLVSELHRWGVAPDVVASLMPNVHRAVDWIADRGERRGDGYLAYRRANPEGLANQGWKDSWDGISFADGRLAEAPVALCEVQGYVYAALVGAAELASHHGEPELAKHYEERAARLRSAFNRDFWLADRGWYAVGLDHEGAPVDALTSNVGHCLWSGIADADKAAHVATHLVSPAMATGWGVRTLATHAERYNPISYHNGSVWPHDTAICVAGLARYGFTDEAAELTDALLDAAQRFNGRLPELFAGLDRSEVPTPAAYPASCSPQAWASAAPLLLLRSMLRFEPDVPSGVVHLAPCPPRSVGRLAVEGVRLAGGTVDLYWNDGNLQAIDGLGELRLLDGPRPPSDTLPPRDAGHQLGEEGR